MTKLDIQRGTTTQQEAAIVTYCRSAPVDASQFARRRSKTYSAQRIDLLLDEPISGLDVTHQVKVLSLVHRLTDKGLGVVIVLHEVNMAARFRDEIIALHSAI